MAEQAGSACPNITSKLRQQERQERQKEDDEVVGDTEVDGVRPVGPTRLGRRDWFY